MKAHISPDSLKKNRAVYYQDAFKRLNVFCSKGLDTKKCFRYGKIDEVVAKVKKTRLAFGRYIT